MSGVGRAGDIDLKRKSGLCWRGCAVKRAWPRCAGVRVLPKVSIAAGRRSAGRKRLSGHPQRQATSSGVGGLRREMQSLKELVAELSLQNRLQKKHARGWGRRLMRYPASEKLEITRLVEGPHLPVRRTLDKLGIPSTTFCRWYAATGPFWRSRARGSYQWARPGVESHPPTTSAARSPSSRSAGRRSRRGSWR